MNNQNSINNLNNNFSNQSSHPSSTTNKNSAYLNLSGVGMNNIGSNFVFPLTPVDNNNAGTTTSATSLAVGTVVSF